MLGCGVSSTVDIQKSPNISHIWMGIWNIEYKIAVENDSKTITYLGLWCFFMCFKTFLRLWCENSVQNGHRYSNPEGEWQLATWDTKCTLVWKNTWHFLHLNGKLLFSLSELSSTTIMTSILLFSDGFSWIFTTVFIFAFGMQFKKKSLTPLTANLNSQFCIIVWKLWNLNCLVFRGHISKPTYKQKLGQKLTDSNVNTKYLKVSWLKKCLYFLKRILFTDL